MVTMTHSMIIQCELIQMNAAFSQFRQNLETHLTAFNQYSADKFAHFKEGVAAQISEWHQILENSHTAIAAWPAALREKKRIALLMKEVERCDFATQTYSHHLEQLEFGDSQNALNQKIEILSTYLERLKREACMLSDAIAKIQINPFIAKIIEGKKTMATRGHFQWGRKLFHSLSGLLGVWLYAFSGFSISTVFGIHIGFAAFTIITEVTRRVSPQTNALICKTMTGFMRERERTQISSATWYLNSTLLVFLLFPKDVALLSLLFIALGDTAAGIVGVKWGRHKITEHVSVEGFLGGFLACLLSALLFSAFGIAHFHLSGGALIGFAALAGLVGALAESSFKRLDDNLVIPLLSAPALWILMRVVFA